MTNEDTEMSGHQQMADDRTPFNAGLPFSMSSHRIAAISGDAELTGRLTAIVPGFNVVQIDPHDHYFANLILPRSGEHSAKSSL